MGHKGEKLMLRQMFLVLCVVALAALSGAPRTAALCVSGDYVKRKAGSCFGAGNQYLPGLFNPPPTRGRDVPVDPVKKKI